MNNEQKRRYFEVNLTDDQAEKLDRYVLQLRNVGQVKVQKKDVCGAIFLAALGSEEVTREVREVIKKQIAG